MHRPQSSPACRGTRPWTPSTSPSSSVDKGQIDLLATSEFVRRKEVVLLLGPPGVGKSPLAAGLGVKAVQNGFSVPS